MEFRYILLHCEHIRSEIGAARRGPRLVHAELCAPNRAFVTNKGADPVTGPVAEHRITVFAARDDHVRVILLQRRERQMSDRTRVAGRDERSGLWGSEARHIERS